MTIHRRQLLASLLDEMRRAVRSRPSNAHWLTSAVTASPRALQN